MVPEGAALVCEWVEVEVEVEVEVGRYLKREPKRQVILLNSVVRTRRKA